MLSKFNWGHGIAIGYSAFACGMLFLVYLCVQQKIELVRPDYYNQELQYQQRINQKANTAALSQRLEITYNRDAKNVTVQLPNELNGTPSLDVRFYRPDDSHLDRVLHQAVSSGNAATLNTAGMKSGLWRMELQWNRDGKSYFQETILNL